MREIGASEARNTLSALLDLVEAGEEVGITRRGTRVARLVPDTPGDREKARRAAANIVARSKGVTLGELKIKDLINEGRR
jgi:prevent-host-death family protein